VRVALLTREYPPDVYGGAGVHVEYLSRELAPLVDLDVHAWRDHPAWGELGDAALRALSIDLRMAEAAAGADVVHSHTWYTQLAGHLAKLLHDIPHVATVHSLEPRRPWKAEQLGGGYRVSSFAERTGLDHADAVIAGSEGSRRDIVDVYPGIDPHRIEVIYNGIDTEEFRPDPRTDALERHGIDPDGPVVLFVGRITRQKGLEHLLDAAKSMLPEGQLVLCATHPDTPQLEAAIESRVDALRARRDSVVWIREMVARPELVQLLTHATVFACPSIYEPLGIVNLEAMACETAVVATATGGILEVVVDDQTGVLVPFQAAGGGRLGPKDPDRFAAEFAERVNALLADPDRAAAMGRAGRRRAVEEFSWPEIARQTAALYRRVVTSR